MAAVDDVSLTVEPGELLTLLGPSGCGKTTTLRMIAGFERARRRARSSIDEQDVTALLPYRRSIGFVFQNYALFPHLTVFENVAYGLRVQRLAASRDRARAVERGPGPGRPARLRAPLPAPALGRPAAAGGAGARRGGRARACCSSTSRSATWTPSCASRCARRSALQRRLGITTVYVTHDQEEAMAISDRIAVMEAGGWPRWAPPHDLYRAPALACSWPSSSAA